MEKLDKLLLHIYRNTKFLYQEFKVDQRYTAIGYAQSQQELFNMFGALASLGYLQLRSQTHPPDYMLTLSGIEKAEELLVETVKSDQCFVAMWFDEKILEIYEKYITRAIVDTGYKSLIILDKEHNNDICDEIIAEIRRSRFLVADFTGQRGGVYFEAGFAYGLGIPVIWTCQDS